MASLSDVLAGILNQINRGRSQADAAAIEIANIYREHPLLSSFPIPRVTLEEATIDLKMSISQVPSKSNYFSPEIKEEIIKHLRTIIADLPEKEPLFGSFLRKAKGFRQHWDKTQFQPLEKIRDIIPEDSEADPNLVAVNISNLISLEVSKAVTNPGSRVGLKSIREFSSFIYPKLEENITKRIKEIINQMLEQREKSKERFEILISADELEKIPMEKLTSMRFTIKESDRSWTQIETESGEMKDKLIPS